MSKDYRNTYLACPLCELSIVECVCTLQHTPGAVDLSCSIKSMEEEPVCFLCGKLTKGCLCELAAHRIIGDTGMCGRCGTINPDNQLCNLTNLAATSTPVRKSGRSARKRLFDDIPPQYITNSEIPGGYQKADFENYQIRASYDTVIKPGLTASIPTNIILLSDKEKPAGFFSLVNQHNSYWLYKPCHENFKIKEGIIPAFFSGSLFVSMLNKTKSEIAIASGTSIGCLQFNKFV